MTKPLADAELDRILQWATYEDVARLVAEVRRGRTAAGLVAKWRDEADAAAPRTIPFVPPEDEQFANTARRFADELEAALGQPAAQRCSYCGASGNEVHSAECTFDADNNAPTAEAAAQDAIVMLLHDFGYGSPTLKGSEEALAQAFRAYASQQPDAVAVLRPALLEVARRLFQAGHERTVEGYWNEDAADEILDDMLDDEREDIHDLLAAALRGGQRDD